MIHFDVDNLKQNIKKIESETENQNFWTNNPNSNQIITDLKRLQNKLKNFEDLNEELNNLEDLNELLLVENDIDLSKEV